MPDERVQVLPDGTVLQRNKIPDYALDGLGACIKMWQKWEIKNMLPFSGGWQEQPADIIDMFDTFDAVHNAHEAHEAEMRALTSKPRHR